MTTVMQNAGEEIRFTFDKFSLGMVLVAATEKGIAAILLGDGRDELHRELVYAFPKAHSLLTRQDLRTRLAKIAAFLDAPHQGLDLPLDIRGSAQEQAVWQALRNVPAGQTINLWPDRQIIAAARHRPGCGCCMRRQCAGRRHSLPPGGQGRWFDFGLPLGCSAQAETDQSGSRGMSRLEAIDWPAMRRFTVDSLPEELL